MTASDPSLVRPAPERILLIRPSALGDVARTVPMIVSLRKAFPRARIDWLVQEGFEAVIASHPDLDEAIGFPRKALGRSLRKGSIGQLTRWTRMLRERRYDVVIDAQGLFRSAWIAWTTGAKIRVGHAEARECAGIFYSRRIHARSTHTVDRMLDLLCAVGVDPVRDMRLYVGDGVSVDAPDGSIVLAPTSRWAAKRWPADRFGALTRRLLARTPHTVSVVGGPDERDQCEEVLAIARSNPRVVDLVGKTDVAGLARAIAGSRLVIANDSAAAHIAVGFDRPLVALYGPTNTACVGPYRRESDVLQRLRPEDNFAHKDPKNVEAMRRIDVEDVWRACVQRLGTANPSAPVEPRRVEPVG
ncbi:MAG: hypothetical protein CMJ31_05970 [Phycisphaerae bacterium]|nr:hypothetical protein [Phycisphaerae bacterium]